ncbi:MAG TPA: trehalase family glycosidase [Puia sp.]|jgi:hypothetical protein
MKGIKYRFAFIIAIITLTSSMLCAQAPEKVYPGADEQTPSRAEYFSWINNTNEGSTEKQTLINLDFFKWLRDTYGMHLDIYAMDAGNIDGKGFCGSMSSERFKRQFPNSFDNIYKKAASLDTRLGIWGGPDCFGNTPASQQARIDMMVSLCRDYKFELFKFDQVNGDLRTEKQDAFIEMMKACRRYSPDLILLNHRLNLGKALPYATTFLLGSDETYIDVHMSNTRTAPHHRQGALAREEVPGLRRLTEDHGVCLSSCLDYWDDDLLLQAFNRSLILAPEIYGNPWLLRDDEYPRLARIFNLHRQYGRILVNGLLLPASHYGDKAVSRGDSSTRFITLRNMSWETVTDTISLDGEIGLAKGDRLIVRQFYPTEKIIGRFRRGQKVAVNVLPFRSCMIGVSSAPWDEIGIEGCDYEVVDGQKDRPLHIDLLGMPGQRSVIRLDAPATYASAALDGTPAPSLLKGRSLTITFPGTPLKEAWHRKLGDLLPVELPADAEALYEATCFAADNNALEVRSLYRSGPTHIPQVEAARAAFFDQPLFRERGLWDKYLFDGDLTTGFSISRRFGTPPAGVFRLDLGQAVSLDKLVLQAAGEYDLQPLKIDEAAVVEVSSDGKAWKAITFLVGKTMEIGLDPNIPVRDFRFREDFDRLLEINGYKNGVAADRSRWRASNLFAGWRAVKATKAWSTTFTLNEIPKGSYLCIALNGSHGIEGAYAAIRVDGKPVGAPDRSVSYASNTWEYRVKEKGADYTYYIPLTEDMKGKKIDAVVLGMKNGLPAFKPEVWITAYPAPFERKSLVLSPYGLSVDTVRAAHASYGAGAGTTISPQALLKAVTSAFMTLQSKCIRPAEGYLRHDYLIPAGYYKQMWDWDGFFIGCHLASENKGNIKYLKEWVLNFANSADTAGYVSGCITTEGPRPIFGKFSMKPFLSQGTYLASKWSNDFGWITPAIYDRLRSVLRYRESTQYDPAYGLFFWDNAMQSGADNNVALTNDPKDQAAILGTDINTFQLREYRSMSRIAAALGHPSDEAAYAAKADKLKKAIMGHLWFPKEHSFFNIRRDNGRPLRRISYSNFVPLIEGVELLPEAEGREMIKKYLLNKDHMLAGFGLRSLSKQDSAYNNRAIITPYSNWQGPVWVIANYLYFIGLEKYGFKKEARELSLTLGSMVLHDVEACGSMHEDYDADTGAPLAPTAAQSKNGVFTGFVGWNLLVQNMLEGSLQDRQMLLDLR